MHAVTQSVERISANVDIELSDNTIFAFGIVFIMAGVGLLVPTAFGILMREQALSNANLSLEERWRIEGSLQWWRESSDRLFYPLAFGLLGVGMMVMLSTLLLSRALSPRKKGKK